MDWSKIFRREKTPYAYFCLVAGILIGYGVRQLLLAVLSFENPTTISIVSFTVVCVFAIVGFYIGKGIDAKKAAKADEEEASENESEAEQ